MIRKKRVCGVVNDWYSRLITHQLPAKLSHCVDIARRWHSNISFKGSTRIWTERVKKNLNNDSQTAAILRRLVDGVSLTRAELEVLSVTDDVEQRLIQLSGSNSDTVDRTRIFLRAYGEVRKLSFDVELRDLWNRYLPLSQVLITWTKAIRPIVGIAGIPGTGKTSFANILSTICNGLETPTAVVSLDDFYLTPEERKIRGYRWRAVPGTHDLVLLNRFLEQAKSESSSLLLPRYDTRAEERLSPLRIDQAKLVLFEGWFVGAPVPGYEVLHDSLDYLIYLDADLEWAHQSRLNREARIRKESNGRLGLSEPETQQFWNEALLPGSVEWVLPLKARADVVVEIENGYRIGAIEIRREGDSRR